MSNEIKMFAVTLVKSLLKRAKNHQASARGLGLKKIRQTVVVPGTPENLGMIKQINYLVKVEEVKA